MQRWMVMVGLGLAAVVASFQLLGCANDFDDLLARDATTQDDGSVEDAGPGDAGGGLSDGAGDAAVVCEGDPPTVGETARYCPPGQCYCPESDTCFEDETTATACCDGPVWCQPEGEDGEPECGGRHPDLVDGDRICAAGECYCGAPANPDMDACFDADVADLCCGAPVVCY